jgi:hypothetical protein
MMKEKKQRKKKVFKKRDSAHYIIYRYLTTIDVEPAYLHATRILEDLEEHNFKF